MEVQDRRTAAVARLAHPQGVLPDHNVLFVSHRFSRQGKRGVTERSRCRIPLSRPPVHRADP